MSESKIVNSVDILHNRVSMISRSVYILFNSMDIYIYDINSVDILNNSVAYWTDWK